MCRKHSKAAFTALTLALAACGGGSEPPHVAPRLLPTPAAAIAPRLPSQVFAEADPAYGFPDPARRSKLASAFPKIDEIAEDELKKQNLPGLAVGVVVDGELAYAKGFGVADLESKVRPDADTVYRIGSITKSFTAMTLLALRDQGLVSLDDPLARWVPEAGALVYPTHDSPPITLRHVLTHSAGLPRTGRTPIAGADSPLTEEELMGSLAGLGLDSAPGTEHVYSNLGFGLLGIVAGRAAKAPYREVVTQRVLAPLGMTSTVWDRASVPAGRLATAYKKGPLGTRVATPHWLLGAREGAGGLYSTVRDMARYVAFQLAAYPPRSTEDTGPIRRSSAREAHFNALKDSLHVRLSRAPSKGESVVRATAQRYGYGWVAEQTCEFDELVWHNGSVDGYGADVIFLPQHGVGVIVLVNLGGSAPEPVASRALAALRGTGGLSKRAPKVPSVFEPAMKKFLEVYNAWDDQGYKDMLTPGRSFTAIEEKAELSGYKQLHGVCKGYSPVSSQGGSAAVFALDCERGSLEMSMSLAPDGLISGFSGTSRDLPIPPELRTLGDRLAGLVKKWDATIYKRHLSGTKKPVDETQRFFDDLRTAHRACTPKSFTNLGSAKKLVLECEAGGDMLLGLAVDPKTPDAITSYTFEGMNRGTCPVR